DHARQRDGQPARRPRYKQPVAGAAPENALEEAEVLLVLIVDALAEALAHVELIARPPREVEAQDIGVLLRKGQQSANDLPQLLASIAGLVGGPARTFDELVDVAFEQAAQHRFLGGKDL